MVRAESEYGILSTTEADVSNQKCAQLRQLLNWQRTAGAGAAAAAAAAGGGVTTSFATGAAAVAAAARAAIPAVVPGAAAAVEAGTCMPVVVSAAAPESVRVRDCGRGLIKNSDGPRSKSVECRLNNLFFLVFRPIRKMFLH